MPQQLLGGALVGFRVDGGGAEARMSGRHSVTTYADGVRSGSHGPTRAAFRAARAAAFTLTALLLAVVGHGLAQGAAVSSITSAARLIWAPLLVGSLVVGALAWRLSRRERGFAAIATATIGVQAGWHLMLAAAEGGGGPAPRTVTAALLWCHHGAAPLRALPVGTHVTGSELLTTGAPATGSSVALLVTMLAFHALAALASSWVLLRGERALGVLARLIDRAVSRLPRLPRLAGIALVGATRVRPAGPVCWCPSGLRPLLWSAQRRGPPALAGIAVPAFFLVAR